MNFIYVSSPASFWLEGEFGFGANHGASLYHTRLQALNIFKNQDKHKMYLKCGYGEERNPHFYESKLLTESHKGLELIPTSQKLTSIVKDEIIVFERLSTAFYEFAFCKNPILVLVPNREIISNEFLEIARDRAVICDGKEEFLKQLKSISESSNEVIKNLFKEKKVSSRLRDLLIGNSDTNSLERHIRAIGMLNY